jgi:hypothetical protein
MLRVAWQEGWPKEGAMRLEHEAVDYRQIPWQMPEGQRIESGGLDFQFVGQALRA